MKGNKIIELQIGFHTTSQMRFQRVITNEYFDEYQFEHHSNDGHYTISYSAQKPQIKDNEVSKACDNMDLVLKCAKINFENNDIVATIRNDEIVFGNEIDIWKDVKVWIKGTYDKYQSQTLFYTKHSYSNKYLKDGFTEDKLLTDSFYFKGDVIRFEIESYNMRNRYTAIIDGYNRYKFEAYNTGFEGRYHGYYYFNSFKEVQEFFKSRYNKILVQKGETKLHRC